MPLLNYTTKIEASKTISEIQSLLAKNGATSILTEYDNNGYIIALSFQLLVNENYLSIKLPSDWRPVLEVMKKDKLKNSRIICTQDQALKVSWRIIKDWVEAQMAIIQTRMVKMEQVFLPYTVTNNGQTFFERVITDPKLLLN